jgi:hypothetical protein
VCVCVSVSVSVCVEHFDRQYPYELSICRLVPFKEGVCVCVACKRPRDCMHMRLRVHVLKRLAEFQEINCVRVRVSARIERG